MKINLQTKVFIDPTPPFDFDPTFHKPDHFTSGDNLWEPAVRWQTWNWKDKNLGLKFKNAGTKDKPKIEVDVYSERSLDKDFIDSLVDEIKYRYNLDLDLTGFYKKFKDDEILSPIIKKWKGMRPGHPSSLYEYLIIGIVLQNATVRRSIQMFKVLLENYGTKLKFDGKMLWCFWKPGRLQKVSEDELRTLKVGYRARSIKKIDDHFFQGLISEDGLRKKDRETQMTELLKLYGVGPATVWYLLFDVFHHWDFFNHVSPWEQKIYSKLFFNKDPENPVPVKKILKYFEKFGDYKQLAVHYIWEDLWWKRKNKKIDWLEKLIRV
ncbi:MAG: DNA-3-methyladenine glycosidase [Candidatus Woesebacteria bacterium GW2011_GWB1_45_5]|uniref:DNA-3-methyladenine glycosidase n=1 Tax=Candidatus Woesebacteria bacterium GW2011_GWB1_45_5 TaxID=1618581 RepID=A0A0G1MRT9_9BACT|nr:MAG: DNA-3-methyladenine glycosidase [Candidatus Woesebacteria bacterium GW2011_GWB1_45_5]